MSSSKPGKPLPPLDPALFEPPEMHAALARQDVGAVYRALEQAGVSQRQISRRTGQSQSEVCEIRKGREVVAYKVLVRICEGLGVPRERMGLSWYGPDGSYAGDVTVAESPKGVSEEMKRRTVVGALSVAVVGESLVGDLVELALPAGEPLPSRLEMFHVHIVRTAIEQLRGLARQHGGQADLFAAAARQFTRWLEVPGTDVVKAKFAAALSELHTEAGWCCYDSGIDGRGHFTRAAALADWAGDTFGVVNAAWHAGATMVRAGHPNEALQCFQLGHFQLMGHAKTRQVTFGADDPRMAAIAARCDISSAAAYALLDQPHNAKHFLAAARDRGAGRDAFDRADADLNAALILRDLGRGDAAQSCAQTAARTFDEHHSRGRAVADVVSAEVHLQAGEPKGPDMAKRAIDSVATLHSVVLQRVYLPPLINVLDARPGADARELARMARKVAATRA
ncbi:MAG: helix-turn-helix domain-containing protein [Pseudonocardiaceae bacterium]